MQPAGRRWPNIMPASVPPRPDQSPNRRSMNQNLIRVQEEVEFGKAGIVQLAENAFESAWLPRATKDQYIAELKADAG